MKIIGLSIANELVALSGGIFAQKNGFFEITMGTGALVTGVASVIIGTSIFRKLTFVKATTAVVIGSILYKACVQLAMSQDILVQQDQKLITSMLFLIILVTSNERKRRVKAHA